MHRSIHSSITSLECALIKYSTSSATDNDRYLIENLNNVFNSS